MVLVGGLSGGGEEGRRGLEENVSEMMGKVKKG